jgi:hypothetical protein
MRSAVPTGGFLLTFMCATTSRPVQHALDQQFELAAGGLLAEQARLDHLRVVEHQQVAGAQQRRQLAEDAVDRREPVPSSRREPLRSAAGCWAISSGGRAKSKSPRVK